MEQVCSLKYRLRWASMLAVAEINRVLRDAASLIYVRSEVEVSISDLGRSLSRVVDLSMASTTTS